LQIFVWVKASQDLSQVLSPGSSLDDLYKKPAKKRQKKKAGDDADDDGAGDADGEDQSTNKKVYILRTVEQ
jgi:hypothetical protein